MDKVDKSNEKINDDRVQKAIKCKVKIVSRACYSWCFS